MKIKCRDTKEIARSYAEYLTTQHWQLVRKMAFIKSNGICKCCKKPLNSNFVAHHKTYERIGKERVRISYSKKFLIRILQKIQSDDVIAVCPHCHDGKSKNHQKLHEFVRVPNYAKRE
jgi:hypothetical protein